MLVVLGILLAACVGPLTRADEVQCWAPDGKTLADNNTVVPCNKLGIQQAGVYSSCCRLDGVADQRDLCTTTGLCLSTADGVIRREFCTDKTWKSPACVNVCTDPLAGGVANGAIEMTACADGTGTYCCGHNNLTCCGTHQAVVIPTQASVMSSGTPNSSSGAFKNATIGLAVVLGVILLAAAGVVTWLLRKNKSVQRQLAEKMEATGHAPPSIAVHPYHDSQSMGPPQFKDSPTPRAPSDAYEMTGNQLRYSELDASIAATRSEMGSPVHQHDSGMGSPRSIGSHPRSPYLQA
ncbi:hypothetical protein F5Y19DRAFT_440576 [Xylariaceae sp. FL1651]|nr:hypothetical protein F5Y19DRAFT_440576 [Xylariaceae sp. FL1651]